MGASAFVLLLAAEIALSIWLFGNSIEVHLANYRTAHGTIGLVGQFVFAVIPVLQLNRGR